VASVHERHITGLTDDGRIPMPTVEERISAVEAKVDAIADFRTEMIRLFTEFKTDMNRQFADVRTDMNRQFAEVRADMNRQFGEVRSDMDRRFTEVDRRFTEVDRRFTEVDRRAETLDQRMERHFMWMVGIQFSVLIAVIVALIQTSAR
jgi:hypothetical protein